MTVLSGWVTAQRNYTTRVPPEYCAKKLTVYNRFGTPTEMGVGGWECWLQDGLIKFRYPGWKTPGTRLRPSFRWATVNKRHYQTYLSAKNLRNYRLVITPGPKVLTLTRTDQGIEIELPRS